MPKKTVAKKQFRRGGGGGSKIKMMVFYFSTGFADLQSYDIYLFEPYCNLTKFIIGYA